MLDVLLANQLVRVLLANQLVRALVPGVHLQLVGDPDQLPSVGAGDVLADLLGSGQFPVTRLNHIFRQGAGSGIAENARRVNAGELPRFGRDVQDCFFVPAEQPAAAADVVVDLVARRLPKAYGFGPGQVQVLVPMHRGDVGVVALNARLQERLNTARVAELLDVAEPAQRSAGLQRCWSVLPFAPGAWLTMLRMQEGAAGMASTRYWTAGR